MRQTTFWWTLGGALGVLAGATYWHHCHESKKHQHPSTDKPLALPAPTSTFYNYETHSESLVPKKTETNTLEVCIHQPHSAQPVRLTILKTRRLQVLQLTLDGWSNHEIATHLKMTPKMVESDKTALQTKGLLPRKK